MRTGQSVLILSNSPKFQVDIHFRKLVVELRNILSIAIYACRDFNKGMIQFVVLKCLAPRNNLTRHGCNILLRSDISTAIL